mmetsp:Transcript_12243/g.34299  ORF Transcript_12243/g.34299 Transcript_12243/m.34299 type:complete len:310 (+) Transcript_12243:1880-2809(+)
MAAHHGLRLRTRPSRCPREQPRGPSLGLPDARLRLVVRRLLGRAQRVVAEHGLQGRPPPGAAAGAARAAGAGLTARVVQQEGLDAALALQLDEAPAPHLRPRGQPAPGVFAHLQLARQPFLHVARGGVDGVSEEPKSRQLPADYPCDQRPSVDPHLQLDSLLLHGGQDAQGHAHQPAQHGAVVLALVLGGDADRGHVLLRDRLDLGHPVGLADLVDVGEQLVQEQQHLGGLLVARVVVEIHDHDKQNGRAAHRLCDQAVWVAHLGHDDVSGQHSPEDIVRLLQDVLLLLVQEKLAFRPLLHEILLCSSH